MVVGCPSLFAKASAAALSGFGGCGLVAQVKLPAMPVVTTWYTRPTSSLIPCFFPLQRLLGGASLGPFASHHVMARIGVVALITRDPFASSLWGRQFQVEHTARQESNLHSW